MAQTIRYICWTVIAISLGVFVVLEGQAPAGCDDDWRKCDNLKAFLNSASDGLLDAQADCRFEASRRAQYGEPRWGYGFARLVPDDSNLESGRVRLLAKNAEFQNGFGAYRKVDVLCTYDLQDRRVADLRIGAR